uniref:Wall-associated receptor kinase C-terminal domain-containing protein n=1 Tax=Aegilops tauschii subsp. strangulata TaxID=200361 RepID=A0A452XDV6_AEGTS
DGALATVSLADPNVDDDRNTCPRPRIDHNITLQKGSLLYFPDSAVDYLIFFIDCIFNSTFHQPNSIYPISCEGFDAGPRPGLSFVLPDDAVPTGNWVQACNQVIQLPVHKYGEINLTDPGWTNGSGYASVLRQEFQLGWNESAKDPACIQCEGSNPKGQCGYSRTGDFIGCLCPDGLVHSDNTCNKSRKFSESQAFPLQKLRFSSCPIVVSPALGAFFPLTDKSLISSSLGEIPHTHAFSPSRGSSAEPKHFLSL